VLVTHGRALLRHRYTASALIVYALLSRLCSAELLYKCKPPNTGILDLIFVLLRFQIKLKKHTLHLRKNHCWN